MKGTQMDYSNLTDEELDNILMGKVVAPPRSTPIPTTTLTGSTVNDYSNLTDEELDALLLGYPTQATVSTPSAEASKGFTMNSTAQNIAPTSEPYISKSEEFTGTLAPGEAKPYRSGTITAFNDPAQQAVVGLVKGGDIIINALESIDSPLEIIQDPGRVVDYITPFANFAIGASEWLVQKTVDAVGKVAGDTDTEITFPRITGKFGKYPEQQDPLYQKLEKSSKERKAWIRSYEETFKKYNNSTPIIEEVVSYAPDALTLATGAIANIPKYAAVMEGLFAGARAETEGEDVPMARATGAAFGYFGTKAVNTFMNRLTPKEAAQINMLQMNPELKEDHLTLLKFYQDNPQFSPTLLEQGKTGNPVIDKIVERQREQLGSTAYKEFMGLIHTLGDKSRQSITEVTEEFVKGSADLKAKLSNNANEAWDALSNTLDSTQVVDGRQLAADVSARLAEAPDVIKNFSRRVLNSNTNDLLIKEAQNRKAILHANYLADKETTPANNLKALTSTFNKEKKAIDEEIVLLKGMDAQASQNVTASSIIEMIKKINDKAFVAGGNVNLKDKKQLKALGDLRAALEDALGNIPGVEKVKEQYMHARAASKDMYDTLGYAAGKNKNRSVYSHELGEVLEEEFPQQVKIVQTLVGETPQVFLSKMQGLEGKLPDDTLNKLKKLYLEQRVNSSVTKLDKVKNMPRVSAEEFDASISPLLDSSDGRNMISQLYGKHVLDSLNLVRALNKELGTAATQGIVPSSTFKAWTRELPQTMSTIFTQRIKDYNYVRRMLEGYGEKVNFDWADFAKEHLASRVAGAAAGATLSPEGYEVEGIAAGAWLGKAASASKLLKNSELGKKVITKAKDVISSKSGTAAIAGIGALTLGQEAQAMTKMPEAKVSETDIMQAGEMPQGLWKAELLGNEHLATQIHGVKTIGAGIDLARNPELGKEVLLRAGVSDKDVQRLLKGDKSVKITQEQAKEASNLMYAYQYKMLSSRVGDVLDTLSAKDKEAVMIAQYYMDLKPSNRGKDVTRNKLYTAVKEGNMKEFYSIINTSNNRVAKEMKNRLTRAGL